MLIPNACYRCWEETDPLGAGTVAFSMVMRSQGPISKECRVFGNMKQVYMRKDLYSSLVETNVLKTMDVAFHVCISI
jgi:hypothetical protein